MCRDTISVDLFPRRLWRSYWRPARLAPRKITPPWQTRCATSRSPARFSRWMLREVLLAILKRRGGRRKSKGNAPDARRASEGSAFGQGLAYVLAQGLAQAVFAFGKVGG